MSDPKKPVVLLAGNPNAGKTTLFNALTGARARTGNYPGVTVERRSGQVRFSDGRRLEVVDVPEVALAATEDLVDSCTRLAELIEWMDSSIVEATQ